MKLEKHWVQWLAAIVLYWMTAYALANLISYVYYFFGFIPQIKGISDFLISICGNLILAFISNQFLNIDLIVIGSSGLVWSFLLYLRSRLPLRILVVVLWSTLTIFLLYFISNRLNLLHSFQQAYYDLFFIRHLVSSVFSTILLSKYLDDNVSE